MAGTLLLGGCVYLNTLYNAQALYRDGERLRLTGQPAAAREAYLGALEKAAESFRRDSTGGWAHPSLLLVGQAHLRLGSMAESRAALQRVMDETTDPRLWLEAQVYLGASLVASGEYVRAQNALSDALRQLDQSDLRGEGHMWRARVFLAQGFVDQGWWDLERAVEENPRLKVPAQLERVAWALARNDLPRAAQGARALLSDPRAAIWADSLSALAADAARIWSPIEAATLLAPARTAPWAPEPRDALRLQRVDLLLAAGETLAAETELGWVAQESGPGAVRARLRLAAIRLARVEEPPELESVRRVLLPAATDEAVVPALERLRVLELLCDPVSASFQALFAGGEIARDELRAPGLARTLFLAAAADTAGGEWRGKAALAALALGSPSEDLEVLESRLGLMSDPYIDRARNRYLPTDTLAGLDSALQVQLDSVRGWALEEALRRDVLVRSRARRN